MESTDDVAPTVVVGLGEALWDVFPNRACFGGACFGGAPANFACMAAQLGGDRAVVHMVTGIGRDDLGRRAVQTLRSRGVDTSHVTQTTYPTGRVNVEVADDGRVRYEIVEAAGWDHVPWASELEKLAHRTDIVCFGSLAQRAPESRCTIQKFVEATPAHALRVFDVNLRPPHDDRTVVLESLRLANVVKLNDEEMPAVLAWSEVKGASVEGLRALARRYDLVAIALTRGAHGAVLVGGNEDEVSDRCGVAIDVVDTVGAGDAFTAALALGLRNGDDLGAVNRHACEVAAYVCTQSGATPLLSD